MKFGVANEIYMTPGFLELRHMDGHPTKRASKKDVSGKRTF